MEKKLSRSLIIGWLILLLMLMSGCGPTNRLTDAQSTSNTNEAVSTEKSNSEPSSNDYQSFGGIDKQQLQQLAKLDFYSGDKVVVEVNGGHSTLNPKAWQSNHIIYSPLDSLNRTSSPNTAFLEERNIANSQWREQQTFQPSGWHYNHGRNQIYNRGHLIAYSLSAGIDQNGNYQPNDTSGDQNNPKNLFTQSAYTNQKVQTYYEGLVRTALRQHKKVIYQATAVFRGDERMARGINLQAVSTDGSLDFNVYIYNVQPGVAFDYQTGRWKVDRSMQVSQ